MPTETCAFVRFPARVSENFARRLISHALGRFVDDVEIDGGKVILREAQAAQVRNPRSPGESYLLDLCSTPYADWGHLLREFAALVVLDEGCTIGIVFEKSDPDSSPARRSA